MKTKTILSVAIGDISGESQISNWMERRFQNRKALKTRRLHKSFDSVVFSKMDGVGQGQSLAYPINNVYICL